MVFRNIDDIERESKAREKSKLENEISSSINNVLGNVKNERRKNRSSFVKFLFFCGFIILLLMAINLVLVNVWFFKLLIKVLTGF